MDLLSVVTMCNDYTIMLYLPVSCLMTWVYISYCKLFVRFDDRLISLDFIIIFVLSKDRVFLCTPCYVALFLHIKRYGRNTELNRTLALEINWNRVVHTCPRGCNTHQDRISITLLCPEFEERSLHIRVVARLTCSFVIRHVEDDLTINTILCRVQQGGRYYFWLCWLIECTTYNRELTKIEIKVACILHLQCNECKVLVS